MDQLTMVISVDKNSGIHCDSEGNKASVECLNSDALPIPNKDENTQNYKRTMMDKCLNINID